MKVQLIVVQGKPEGKEIPLTVPKFRIGRGETCHLRPNSELVSREHTEFQVSSDKVMILDLGSRNGTLVNGKAVTEPTALKNGDLVQIGPLTFAVSIQGAPTSTSSAPTPAPAAATPVAAAKAAPLSSNKIASIDDVGHDEIDSWLIADEKSPTPERPSGVYGGDTITIKAFRDAAAAPAPAAPEATDEEYERQADGENATDDAEPDTQEQEAADASAETSGSVYDIPEDLIDESNPFYKKKEQAKAPEKVVFKDSSDAASEILRKMMERRKSSK